MARYRYQKTNYNVYVLVLIMGIVIGLVASFALYYSIPETEAPVVFQKPRIAMYSEINLVAVDQDGNGVSTPLTVEVIPGDGKVLTNIEKMLFWIDTQFSIQTARIVAKNVTNVNTYDYDLIYNVKTNATLVGGPSAGAALTVATIAALENKTLKNDIIITGTIEPDGTIGQVGGILEKAIAAKSVGVNTLLVPSGQGEQTFLEPNETCVRRGSFIFCETIYEQTTVNIGDDTGITVIEVENIQDAMEYFGL